MTESIDQKVARLMGLADTFCNASDNVVQMLGANAGMDEHNVYWVEMKRARDALEAALRTELSVAQAEPIGGEVTDAAFKPDKLEVIIDEFIDGYEMYGEDAAGRDGTYTPNDHERYLIKDAIMGLLADPDWDAEWGKHIDRLAATPTKPDAKDAATQLPSAGDVGRVQQRSHYPQCKTCARGYFIGETCGWICDGKNWYSPIDHAIASTKPEGKPS